MQNCRGCCTARAVQRVTSAAAAHRRGGGQTGSQSLLPFWLSCPPALSHPPAPIFILDRIHVTEPFERGRGANTLTGLSVSPGVPWLCPAQARWPPDGRAQGGDLEAHEEGRGRSEAARPPSSPALPTAVTSPLLAWRRQAKERGCSAPSCLMLACACLPYHSYGIGGRVGMICSNAADVIVISTSIILSSITSLMN